MPITCVFVGTEKLYAPVSAADANCTYMAWMRQSAQSGTHAYLTLNNNDATTDPHIEIWRRSASGLIVFSTADGARQDLTDPTANTWFHAAAANTSGGNATAYIRADGSATYTSATTTGDDVAPNRMYIGNDGFDTASQSCEYAFVMVFNQVLSETQIYAQSHFMYPIWDSCILSRPLWDEATIDLDYAGNGNAWVDQNSNIDAADITDFTGGLPFSITAAQAYQGHQATTAPAGGTTENVTNGVLTLTGVAPGYTRNIFERVPSAGV